MNPLINEFPSALQFPGDLSVTFEGFGASAFETLASLKEEPHIATYRALKPIIKESITDPFKRFRDDLVVNWVLPNALPYETERNVFSRLLKNDFGAGGCHHHLWMSFYRTGLKRLRDIQLAHTIRDNGFSSSLYIGNNAPALLKQVKKHMTENPSEFVSRVNELLEDERWAFRVRPHKAGRKQYVEYTKCIQHFPDEIEKAQGVWWSIFYSKDAILNQGSRLLELSLQSIQALWPLYLFLLDEPH